jgi:hypothetical protein
MNPIESAVLPLKEDAMNAAEQRAIETIERVATQLVEAGNDLQICAPYPSTRTHGCGHEYYKGLAKYQTFRALTRSRHSGSRSIRDPELADMDEQRKQLFIKKARENAAEEYDAFVMKLVHKIGDTTEAELEGNHIFAHSLLRVVKIDGSRETWKTQQIWNVSKLGKDFPQWPSRKVKS